MTRTSRGRGRTPAPGPDGATPLGAERRVRARDVPADVRRDVVQIHPFPNGNGRHARLLADALLAELGAPPFTWGAGDLDREGDVRARYLDALHRADAGGDPLRH